MPQLAVERPGNSLALVDVFVLQSYDCHLAPPLPRDRFLVPPLRLVPAEVHCYRYNCGPLLCLLRKYGDRSPPGRTPPACLLAFVPPPGARVSAACALPSLYSSALKSLHPHASATAQTTRARRSR